MQPDAQDAVALIVSLCLLNGIAGFCLGQWCAYRSMLKQVQEAIERHDSIVMIPLNRGPKDAA